VPQKRLLKWAAFPAAASLILLLSGCAQAGDVSRGYLPNGPTAGGTEPATNHTNEIVGLWTTSWIVLLIVGVISWGLLGFAAIAYRRRKNDEGLPVQLRYNMPIETLFTVVPLILVVGFFAYTAKSMATIEQPVTGSNKIAVIGKQWSWDFGYEAQNVYDSGVQLPDAVFKAGSDAYVNNTPGNMHVPGEPVLYLVQNQPVELDMRSRDVIHSFWIVDFLYKKDVFPGGTAETNHIYFTPQRLGTFEGKCAELCGEYHSAMLFQVKVVTQAEYDAHIAELRAKGFVGDILSPANDRNASGDNNPAATKVNG
jgi:cytochrome c oxidase subunit 2